MVQRMRAAVGVALLVAVGGCERPMAGTRPVEVAATQVAPAGFVDVKALVIVRHADIDVTLKKTMGGKVPLNERGEMRARELAYALKDAGITRIVTSETLRTQET